MKPYQHQYRSIAFKNYSKSPRKLCQVRALKMTMMNQKTNQKVQKVFGPDLDLPQESVRFIQYEFCVLYCEENFVLKSLYWTFCSLTNG